MSKVLVRMYSVKNLGDDLFLRVLSERFPNDEFYVASHTKYKKECIAENVHIKYNVLSKIKDILLARYVSPNAHYDAYILMGGSIFIEQQDSQRCLHEKIKHIFPKNKPSYIIGSNFGPYSHDFYKEEYENLFRNLNGVTFRDKKTYELFSGLHNSELYPDVIFGLDVNKYRVNNNKKVAISVINLDTRPSLKRHKKIYESKIADIADCYADAGYEVVLLSFCEYEGDGEAVKRIKSAVRNQSIRTFYYNCNLDDAINEISTSEIVIGTRFHSVVLGILFNKKVLPIVYSEKTFNMLKDIDMEKNAINIQDIASLQCSYGNIKFIEINQSRVNAVIEKSKHHFDGLSRVLEA